MLLHVYNTFAAQSLHIFTAFACLARCAERGSRPDTIFIAQSSYIYMFICFGTKLVHTCDSEAIKTLAFTSYIYTFMFSFIFYICLFT